VSLLVLAVLVLALFAFLMMPVIVLVGVLLSVQMSGTRSRVLARIEEVQTMLPAGSHVAGLAGARRLRLAPWTYFFAMLGFVLAAQPLGWLVATHLPPDPGAMFVVVLVGGLLWVRAANRGAPLRNARVLAFTDDRRIHVLRVGRDWMPVEVIASVPLDEWRPRRWMGVGLSIWTVIARERLIVQRMAFRDQLPVRTTA
jgi:hypothetical protein